MPELILVVDDEPKIVRIARDYLEKNGFRVITAADGHAALATARREKPDLIILDLMLPLMDGREVCKTLRRESDVPIIMLTALAEEVDQVTGLERSNHRVLSVWEGWRSTRTGIRSRLTMSRSNSHPTNLNCCN